MLDKLLVFESNNMFDLLNIFDSQHHLDTFIHYFGTCHYLQLQAMPIANVAPLAAICVNIVDPTQKCFAPPPKKKLLTPKFFFYPHPPPPSFYCPSPPKKIFLTPPPLKKAQIEKVEFLAAIWKKNGGPDKIFDFVIVLRIPNIPHKPNFNSIGESWKFGRFFSVVRNIARRKFKNSVGGATSYWSKYVPSMNEIY